MLINTHTYMKTRGLLRNLDIKKVTNTINENQQDRISDFPHRYIIVSAIYCLFNAIEENSVTIWKSNGQQPKFFYLVRYRVI